jgi:hypothetical protein
VAGSQFAPYGLCKHIVAALLAYSHDPMSVRELPELEETLSGLEREELKDHLRQSTSYLPMGKVDVFLHENLVGDAIAAVEGDPFGGLVARVADAAIEREVAPTSTRCRSSLLRIALAAIILRSSPAAILLAGDCSESARGVGDARPEGDRIVDATSR